MNDTPHSSDTSPEGPSSTPSDPEPSTAPARHVSGADTTGPRRPSPWRRTLRWIVITAVLLLTGLIGALAGEAWLATTARLYIESELAAEIDLPLSIDQITVRLLPSALTLNGVTIGSPDNHETSPLATVSTISIRFSTLSLLTQQYIVSSVRMEGPSLTLTPERIDWIRQRFQRQASAWSPAFSSTVQRVSIQDGTIRYVDDKEHFSLAIDDLAGSAQYGLLLKQMTITITQGQAMVSRRQWQHQFNTIRGDAILTSDELTLQGVTVQGPDHRAILSGTMTHDTPPTLDLTLVASLPVADVARLAPSSLTEHRFDGILTMNTQISGPWDASGGPWQQLESLTLIGTLTGKNLAIDQLPVGALLTRFQFRHGTLSLSELSGTVFDGTLRGHGTITVDAQPPQFTVELDLSRHRVGPLLRRLYPSRTALRGFINGHFSAQGRGWSASTINASGDLEFVSEMADSVSRRTPTADATWQDGLSLLSRASLDFHWAAPRLTIRHGTLMSQSNHLNVEGTIDQNGALDLALELAHGSLDELSRLAAIAGRPTLDGWQGTMTAEATIKGAWTDPVVTGSLFARHIQSPATTERAGEVIDAITGSITYGDHTVSFSEMVLEQGAASFSLTGTITLPDPAHTANAAITSEREETGRSNRAAAYIDDAKLSLTIQIADGSLYRTIGLFGLNLPIDGRTTGTLRIRGTPASFLIRGPLKVDDVRLFGQSFSTADLLLELTPQAISFPTLRLSEGRGNLHVAGQIGFDGQYSVEGTLASFSLDRIHWVSSYLPTITGGLTGTLSGTGTWSHPQASGTLNLHDLEAGPFPLGDGTLNWQLAEEQLNITVAVKEPDMTFSGVIELRDDFPVHAQLQTVQFPIVALLRSMFPDWPENVSLIATGWGEVTGHVRHWSDLRGRAEFSQLTAQLADYPIVNDGPVQLSLRSGAVAFDQVRFTGEGTSLGAEGHLTLFQQYDLFLHGEADLAVLRLFFPAVAYGKGKGFLAIQISGQWKDPRIVGGVTVQDGLVRLDSIAQPLRVTYAGLFFDGQRLVLDNLMGSIGNGTVDATGRMMLHRFSPTQYRLFMEVKGIPLTPVEGFSGVIDGTLWFQGDFAERDDAAGGRRHILKGDLQLVRATYSKRVNFTSLLADEPTFEIGEISTPPYLRDVALRLHVWGDRAIWIRNNIAKIPLDLDLEVRGTLEHPVLLGRITTDGGILIFLHTPFKVSQGSINFLDPKTTNPVVDLKTQTNVRDYTVDLVFSGSLNRFVLELTSDPPLSEADILSVLTTGRTSEEVTALGAGTVATAEAAAIILDEFIEDRARRWTGTLINRVRIDPVVDSLGVSAGPQVTIGAQLKTTLLKNPLQVLYSRPMSDPSKEGLLRLEYEINRHISLLGEREDDGRLGGDLKFRFEF